MRLSSLRPIQSPVASPVTLHPISVPDSGAALRRQAYHLRWPVRASRCRATAGLCLLPAGDFLWSAKNGRPLTRADHVLVCLTAGSANLQLPRGAGRVDGVAFLPAGTAFALQPDADAEGMTLLLGRDVITRTALALPSTIVIASVESTAPAALHGSLKKLAPLVQQDPGAMRPDTANGLSVMAKLIATLAAAPPFARQRRPVPAFRCSDAGSDNFPARL